MCLAALAAAACSSGDKKSTSSGSAVAKPGVTAAADDPLGQELAALANLEDKLASKTGEERTAVYEEMQKKCIDTVGKRGVAVIPLLSKRLESARKDSLTMHIAITRCLLDLKNDSAFAGQDQALVDAAMPSITSEDPEVITNVCLLFNGEQAKKHRPQIEAARGRMEERSKKETDPKQADRFKNAGASCNLALI